MARTVDDNWNSLVRGAHSCGMVPTLGLVHPFTYAQAGPGLRMARANVIGPHNECHSIMNQ